MSELDEKMVKRFKTKVAISNLKEEYIMKKSLARKVTTFTLMGALLVFGSFFTVNAATGGELVENIKTAVSVMILKEDGTFEKVDEADLVTYTIDGLSGLSGEVIEGKLNYDEENGVFHVTIEQ